MGEAVVTIARCDAGYFTQSAHRHRQVAVGRGPVAQLPDGIPAPTHHPAIAQQREAGVTAAGDKAHKALTAAGHRPTVVKTYGCFGTDRFFSGRRKIKDLTGSSKVPTLILDDGTIVDGSDKIVAWAVANVA